MPDALKFILKWALSQNGLFAAVPHWRKAKPLSTWQNNATKLFREFLLNTCFLVETRLSHLELLIPYSDYNNYSQSFCDNRKLNKECYLADKGFR